jgi:hypothetical protein
MCQERLLRHCIDRFSSVYTFGTNAPGSQAIYMKVIMLALDGFARPSGAQSGDHIWMGVLVQPGVIFRQFTARDVVSRRDV